MRDCAPGEALSLVCTERQRLADRRRQSGAIARRYEPAADSLLNRFAGPTVIGGMLFVNSGYGQWGGMPGNVLLAFSVDGK